MTELILHHYAASPLSEKIRIILGIKKLSWSSVEIPNLPPKPDVIPLTGGYRRTPFLQIGADVFCDSQLILSELEHRYPSKLENHALTQIINNWCDTLFHPVVRVAVAGSSDTLPKDFLEDRRKLFLNEYPNIESAKERILHYKSQIRAQLVWADSLLTGSNKYLLGETASAADASLFALTWFIKRRWEHGSEFLDEFQNICHWEERVKKIGHGQAMKITSQEALDIAQQSEISYEQRSDVRDCKKLVVGDTVLIGPDSKTGEKKVEGTLHLIDQNRVGLLHKNDRVGTICIHFPKTGYEVTLNNRRSESSKT